MTAMDRRPARESARLTKMGGKDFVIAHIVT